MDEDLKRCVELLQKNEDQVRNDAESALLNLCGNILTFPDEQKYRVLGLSDPVVIEYLLPAIGAMECLFDVGFVEAADNLFLPNETPLSRLQSLHNLLLENSSTKLSINTNRIVDIIPETIELKEEQFFLNIVQQLQHVLRYEDLSLQEKARKLVPIADLQAATMSKMKQIQTHIKSNKKNAVSDAKNMGNESKINAKDLFLVELLHWFKHNFFTWVESPTCSNCSTECTYESFVASTDPRCLRVELHRCENCNTLVKLPRYSDPEILLIYRQGRCGEWANCFTLICRSLGYDARLVHDKTDHVWTEVWSDAEKRWLHLDSCENVIDQPLLYERGWKKELTYIIAYSKDEVQDVTWRYTRDQPNVMKRRNLCSEYKLLQVIDTLSKKLQFATNYSVARRKYVIIRRLLELVELIRMPNEQDFDDGKTYQGRTTGSYAWRLARGEIAQKSSQKNYVWDISKYGRTFQFTYFIVEDKYSIKGDNDIVLDEKSDWQEGANCIEGDMFRKVEEDWKMVYLTRSSEVTYGRIKWNFEVVNRNLCLEEFYFQAKVREFYSGKVLWEVEAFFDSEELPNSRTYPIKDCTKYHTKELKGAVKLILTATVRGGQGNNAWQHAQLFRESLTNKTEPSMVINILLNER